MLIFSTTKSNRRFFLPVSQPESVIPNVATVNQLIKKEYGERNEEPSPASRDELTEGNPLDYCMKKLNLYV